MMSNNWLIGDEVCEKMEPFLPEKNKKSAGDAYQTR